MRLRGYRPHSVATYLQRLALAFEVLGNPGPISHLPHDFTPGVIRVHEFDVVWRGLAQDEVRRYLTELSNDLETLLSQRSESNDPAIATNPARVASASGTITSVVVPSGVAVALDPAARSVVFVGEQLSLAVQEQIPGHPNLAVIDASGVIVKTLATTCGTGVVDQVLRVDGEVRVVEVTPAGDFQARLDLDTLTLERVAEWR